MQDLQRIADNPDREARAVLETNKISDETWLSASPMNQCLMALFTCNEGVWFMDNIMSNASNDLHLTRQSDCVSLHDIEPIGPFVNENTFRTTAVYEASERLPWDICDLIGQFALAPVAHLVLKANGVKLFFEEVYSFPHTGSFRGLLPMVGLPFCTLIVTLVSKSNSTRMPCGAQAKLLCLPDRQRLQLTKNPVTLSAYGCVAKDGMLGLLQ